MSDSFERSTRGALDSRDWGLTRRAWFKASGFTDEDLTKPVIGIAQTWSELNHCHIHFRELAKAVKRGVWQAGGWPLEFPTTAEEWSTQAWVSYWSHTDAPWLTDRLRRRIRDFTTVLGCRYPTITDVRSPPLAKRALRVMSSWRYRFELYDRPWELDLSKKFIKLHDHGMARTARRARPTVARARPAINLFFAVNNLRMFRASLK